MLKGIPSTLGDSYQLNTTTLMRHAVNNFPQQVITHRTNDGQWHNTTYADFGKRVSRLAHALDKLGIGPGTMVGVADWNSLRHFELYFGIPGVAATMLQINIRLAPTDIQYVVNHSNVEWIFIDESLLPIAEAIAKASYVKGFVIMTDKPSSEVEHNLPNAYFYEDLLAEAAEEHGDDYEFQQVEETTACYAGYTTGTTGRPKGVYYSHRSMYLHAMAVISNLKVDFTDVVMPFTPMFHVLSWGFPQAAMGAAAKLVLPGMFSATDIGPVAEAIAREGVTATNGAPALFAPILEYFRSLDTPPDLSRTRMIAGSTEPPVALMKGFKELTGAYVIHGYGATETSPLASINWQLPPWLNDLSEDEQWDIRRAQGLPLLGVESRVVDPTGEDVPHDGKSNGEIIMRGPWITESYYKLDDNDDRFMDGWWRSGDVAVILPSGHRKITDRLKDVIKSGGEWISSIDMENAILDEPAVLEAAVIGVPDAKYDERPVAFVVPRPGKEVTDDMVIDVLKSRFAKWQLPDKIVITDELPRTSVGKLDKKVLRSEWEQKNS
ncbi:AMP-dependent synthetase [Brevibacterium sp. HMSC08F02]|uniref:long-chain-fatty-acid--CoA ligase n=1 Tax=Brevibacterium sp. HMSC08F02 TaxID=1581140 RepID=UPI0008A621D3|nr:long-chain-fatty-acid--CoA ligase [Brevibacterium sp. HMSC08F02]OFT26246.1 AMP-dependent synthetase [Brevibacterium sp. HMSC08F02]